MLNPSGEVLASCSFHFGPTQVRSDLARPSVTSEPRFSGGHERNEYSVFITDRQRCYILQGSSDSYGANEFDTPADTLSLHQARQKNRLTRTGPRTAAGRVSTLRERRGLAQAAIESSRGARGMS